MLVKQSAEEIMSSSLSSHCRGTGRMALRTPLNLLYPQNFPFPGEKQPLWRISPSDISQPFLRLQNGTKGHVEPDGESGPGLRSVTCITSSSTSSSGGKIYHWLLLFLVCSEALSPPFLLCMPLLTWKHRAARSKHMKQLHCTCKVL